MGEGGKDLWFFFYIFRYDINCAMLHTDLWDVTQYYIVWYVYLYYVLIVS